MIDPVAPFETNEKNTAFSSWNLQDISLTPDQILMAEKLFIWLKKQSGNLSHALAVGHGGDFSKEEMRVLEHEIIKRFSPLPEAERYLKVLCKVVDGINSRSSQKLPAPRIPHLTARPKNPFIENLVDSLAKVRTWRAAIANNPAHKVRGDESTPEIPNLGLLFASAILHGGLADANLLIALGRALGEFPSSSVLLETRLAIRLSVSWQGESASEYRLWYPDPHTGTLISQVSAEKLPPVFLNPKSNSQSDKAIRAEIWRQIERYFRAIRLPKPDRPTSLGMMLKAVRIDFQSRLPIVLANYSNRSLVSHSVPMHVMERLYRVSKSRTVTHSANITRTDSSDLITEQNQLFLDMDDLEPYWLQKLRRVFSTNRKPDDIHRQLANLGSPPDTPENCFMEFALHLVSTRSASGNILAPSTACSYLVMVAKRLGGRLGETSPATLLDDTLEDLYKEILQDADQEGSFRGLRRRISKSLREFHHFLVVKHQHSPINEREVLGIGKGLLPVDANLITWDEYERVMSVLPQTLTRLHPTLPAITELGKALQLIFMLSFKCGLRRMEVLMLTCADFAEHDPTELLVRPSDARRLKTKSSTRKLPLYALLDESDRDALRLWKASRMSGVESTISHEKFLFGIPEMGTDVITQDLVFPVIHEAMRSVTGDNSLHFHHLRHSFASWTFMRLMLADQCDITDILPLHPKTTAVLADSQSFRNRLYGRECMTRRHTYAVASLLGHSGPEISLEHYIHTCDILLSLVLSQDESQPQKKPVRIRSAQPRSTVYRWLSNGLEHVPYRMTRNRGLYAIKPIKSTSETDQAHTSAEKNSTTITSDIFDQVWGMLFQHTFHGRQLDELCREIGISLEAGQRMLNKAIEISERRVARGKKGYQHRMMDMVFDRRDRTNITRIPCPEPPRTGHEKKIVSSLAEKLTPLMLQQPELCHKVLSYYLDNVWSSRGYVIFRDYLNFEAALDFLNFMEALGIKKSSMEIISFDPAERSSYVPKWRIMLGIPRNFPITKAPSNGKANVRAKKWLAMMPLFPSGDDLAVGESEKGSNAFRYLMVMGAIVLQAFSPLK